MVPCAPSRCPPRHRDDFTGFPSGDEFNCFKSHPDAPYTQLCVRTSQKLLWWRERRSRSSDSQLSVQARGHRRAAGWKSTQLDPLRRITCFYSGCLSVNLVGWEGCLRVWRSGQGGRYPKSPGTLSRRVRGHPGRHVRYIMKHRGLRACLGVWHRPCAGWSHQTEEGIRRISRNQMLLASDNLLDHSDDWDRRGFNDFNLSDENIYSLHHAYSLRWQLVQT